MSDPANPVQQPSGAATNGKKPSAVWREEMRTRATELEDLTSWTLAQPDRYKPAGDMSKKVLGNLDVALQAADPADKRWIRRWVFTGAAYERTLSSLDAAEVHLLRLAPTRVLAGALPSIQAHVRRYLAKDDPRRLAVDQIIGHHEALLAQEREAQLGHGRGPVRRNGRPEEFGQEQREVLLNAQHAANAQRLRDLMRLRQFRNVLLGGSFVFLVIAVALGAIGFISPTTMPLCFAPEANGQTTIVCPRAETVVNSPDASTDLDPQIGSTVTGGDIALVELLGLLGAALTGAASLRNLRGTTTPYGVSVSLALFKLPTGAVTAVVGLLLMRADFVPGLSALDTSAQILGWAVVFGAAQQLVTRFADSKAAGLLENVQGQGAGGDRPLKRAQPA
jgi:hypothetical protein